MYFVLQYSFYYVSLLEEHENYIHFSKNTIKLLSLERKYNEELYISNIDAILASMQYADNLSALGGANTSIDYEFDFTNFNDLQEDLNYYLHDRNNFYKSMPTLWPVKTSYFTRISSGFGIRANPFNNKYLQFHNGIDIASDWGAEILSGGNGTVTVVGYDKVYGNNITIKHSDQFESFYAHLKRVYVKEGDTVNKGNVIGIMGSTGLSTMQHLHYEVRENGKPVNPVYYLVHKVEK
jgi:murein DD-endopeptidase MepM/ murein hydrolase activator NlpD